MAEKSILGNNLPKALIDAATGIISQNTDDRQSVDTAVLAIIAAEADITVLEQNNERINADILCLVLATNYEHNQTLIMSDKTPDFNQLKATGFRARGYITPSQHDKFVKAIRAVHDGEAWLPRRLVADMLNHFAAGDMGQ